MTMMDLAHHIIAVAHENDIPVTNLQLQKVMFFSLKDALNDDLLTRRVVEETYDQPFLVWRYGPVEKKVYERYRIFGSDSISEPNEEHPEFSRLNEVIIRLLREDPFKLVDKSHDENFWKRNQNKINGWRSNVAYSLYNVRTGTE
ncbi:MAG: hypothetical protein LKJ22_10485 [Liquorilactobacillus nagelii]|jgi:uncharacterized phage-associated protein|uniref:Panacea domain-containing protein n=1 Tax=Liquorilactobacillus nagelii TaxID=82688 RepID=UPI002431BADC|nr:hypothetical protein [Liquorilactobacillus nagelii]MCI1922328.1 hypothetical protein [Liquorilactobacillus nagelii]